MTLEMGMWRINGSNLTRLQSTGVPRESQLEDFIEADPMLLGERLLLIGRQVRTGHGGFIDLLALDAEGTVHVIELKRDKTPREVVAQTLDYGSWVAGLQREELVDIYENYQPDTSLDAAFVEAFGGDTPDQLNGAQIFTIVASSMDSATERIVTFLNEEFQVPINVVFFKHYEDGDSAYLARTWLVTHETDTGSKGTPRGPRTREAWNGRDWYISFGEYAGGRNWADAMKYGFVSAGGGEWYSRTLRNLPVGARVFVCIPGSGYVGVGTVTREAVPSWDAVVDADGKEHQFTGLELSGTYEHADNKKPEYVVSVDWISIVESGDAFWKPGMFANQHSACKLRHQFTIDQVTSAFNLTPETD